MTRCMNLTCMGGGWMLVSSSSSSESLPTSGLLLLSDTGSRGSSVCRARRYSRRPSSDSEAANTHPSPLLFTSSYLHLYKSVEEFMLQMSHIHTESVQCKHWHVCTTLNCATHLSGSPLPRGQSRTPMVPGSAVLRRSRRWLAGSSGRPRMGMRNGCRTVPG